MKREKAREETTRTERIEKQRSSINSQDRYFGCTSASVLSKSQEDTFFY